MTAVKASANSSSITLPVRAEADALGSMDIPVEALYGINTARAMTNFDFSGRKLSDERAFVRAFAKVKAAASRANARLDVLPSDISLLINAACGDLESGRLDAWLLVDMYEGSGGTSLNMNINEVLANRAIELKGHAPGSYVHVHPNDHVNCSQSTNDVVPSAIRIAAWLMLDELLAQLRRLSAALGERQQHFGNMLRLGRTCLQDAQPMTLGQAFGAHYGLAVRCAERLYRLRGEMLCLPLGGTAIGTGFGAPSGYRAAVLEELSAGLGAQCSAPGNAFDAMASADDYLRLAGELNCLAQGLGKLADDFMFLASGPNGGIAELKLPALQAGSSIMPGKVNPVIPMAVRQVAFACAGRYAAIQGACGTGQLEINPYEPLIAAELFEMLRLLANVVKALTDRCIVGLEADEERMQNALLASSAAATALLPILGYARASQLVRKALVQGRPFVDLVVEEGLMSREGVMTAIRESVGIVS
jgi:aspartate ammonia-lyase